MIVSVLPGDIDEQKSRQQHRLLALDPGRRDCALENARQRGIAGRHRWIVLRHEIDYKMPASLGDEICCAPGSVKRAGSNSSASPKSDAIRGRHRSATGRIRPGEQSSSRSSAHRLGADRCSHWQAGARLRRCSRAIFYFLIPTSYFVGDFRRPKLSIPRRQLQFLSGHVVIEMLNVRRAGNWQHHGDRCNSQANAYLINTRVVCFRHRVERGRLHAPPAADRKTMAESQDFLSRNNRVLFPLPVLMLYRF